MKLKNVYMPGFKNSVADPLGKKPGEVGLLILILEIQAVDYVSCNILLFLLLLRTG